MGGGGTQQTTQTSSTASASPQVTALTNKLASGLSGQVDKGTAVYGNPLYAGLSGATTSGVNSLQTAANNPNYGANIGSTLDEFGQIAAGNRMGANDAAWNAVKAGVANDVNASFNNSGRFAGGANAERLGNGLATVDLQRMQGNEARQMAAASALPGLFSASLAPAQTQLAAGSILDADANARRQADADLFNRQNNAGWDTYAKASSILAGTAGAAGQNTTQVNTTPQRAWWETALGLGAAGAGAFF